MIEEVWRVLSRTGEDLPIYVYRCADGTGGARNLAGEEIYHPGMPFDDGSWSPKREFLNTFCYQVEKVSISDLPLSYPMNRTHREQEMREVLGSIRVLEGADKTNSQEYKDLNARYAQLAKGVVIRYDASGLPKLVDKQ